jgi:hypothetical protein
MQQAQQAIVGQIRLLGRAGTRAASTASSAAAAAITLLNGKRLEVAEGDIKLTMPAEWAPHVGTWMAWPVRPDVWRAGVAPARAAFVNVIKAISEFEPVTVIADPAVVRGGGWQAGGARMAHAWRRMHAVGGWGGGCMQSGSGCLPAVQETIQQQTCTRQLATTFAACTRLHPMQQPMRSGRRRAPCCRTTCGSSRCGTTTRGCGTRGRRCGGRRGVGWRGSCVAACVAARMAVGCVVCVPRMAACMLVVAAIKEGGQVALARGRPAFADGIFRTCRPQVVLGEISNCPQPKISVPVGVDWKFNGWGDLYGSYEQDEQVAKKICEVERMPFVSVDMVLEGGSIHVDGEG